MANWQWEDFGPNSGETMNHPQSIIRIMIDMENTATCAQAGILSIGACTFGLPFSVTRDKFYQKASAFSNESIGRVVSKETMQWWDKQDPAMRAEAFSGTQTIRELLGQFELWCMNLINANGSVHLSERIELWSRGAGFDCEILQDAFLEIFGYYPFDFRKHMCQRTVERLMPESLKAMIPKQVSKHHALEDAMYQADVMDVALRNITWQDRGGNKNV